MPEDEIFESVHNYTKFKLVEMLIDRFNNGKTKLDDLNSIEDVVDDILKVISICGLKYHNELKSKFDKE